MAIVLGDRDGDNAWPGKRLAKVFTDLREEGMDVAKRDRTWVVGCLKILIAAGLIKVLAGGYIPGVRGTRYGLGRNYPSERQTRCKLTAGATARLPAH